MNAATRARPTGQGLGDAAAAAFAAYRAGEEHRMSELVDLLTPVLWHVARAQGASAEAAEDAVQHAWIALLRHGETVRDAQAVLGWLMTTVRREAIRGARARRHEATGLDQVAEHDDPGPGPAGRAELDERQQLLWEGVKALGPRCHQLLRVVAFAERPDYASVSRALGMPVGSIGPTRGRCLDKLRRTLVADPRWEGHDVR